MYSQSTVQTTRNEMARLARTLQSEVSELKRVLNDQEASASVKKKELQVITYRHRNVICNLNLHGSFK